MDRVVRQSQTLRTVQSLNERTIPTHPKRKRGTPLSQCSRVADWYPFLILFAARSGVIERRR